MDRASLYDALLMVRCSGQVVGNFLYSGAMKYSYEQIDAASQQACANGEAKWWGEAEVLYESRSNERSKEYVLKKAVAERDRILWDRY